MNDLIVIPETLIREVTNDGNFIYIPIEQIHLFVLRTDAELLGSWCFIVGFIIGITATYFWYRGRIKEWQPEDH